ncbi:MAG: hypothetical protein Q7K57_45680, partial [Burkholderiaceae bacterium]|nr:hypothetical protein [Burkholderiaceae bacterium]
MATTLEYALLAGASYYDTRADINRFPIPDDWSVLSRIPESSTTGFEATAYINSLTNSITQGATQTGSGAQGEWVDAEGGDDQVFTTDGNDLIAGGDGADLIVSGGGGDWIWGDWNSFAPADIGSGWRDWRVTETATPVAGGGTLYSYDID